MSFVIPFSFDKALVRVVVSDETPWFVAKDIADALGYADTAKAVKAHCKSYRPVGVGVSPTLDPQTNIIPERDIYRLVMRSKLPKAIEFEEWVVGTVLPSIRKTGGFGLDMNDPASLRNCLLSYTEKVIALEEKLTEQASKVEALDRISKSEGAMCITDAAKCLQVAPKFLFAWMDTHGWTYRRTGSAERVGYSDKEEAGYLVHKVKTVLWGNGSKQCYRQVRVTPKGVVRLAEIFALSVAA